jgi:hypothetical protein
LFVIIRCALPLSFTLHTQNTQSLLVVKPKGILVVTPLRFILAMNTENCSIGRATDETFLRVENGPRCTVELIEYDIAAGLLLSIRFLTMIAVWFHWRRKKLKFTNRQMNNANISKAQQESWQRRWPIIPTLAIMMVIVWITMFVLIRLNLSSAYNGVTLLLWALTYNGWAFYTFIYQRKIIRLGKKVLGGARSMLSQESPELQNFDINLKLLFFVEFICILVQSISGIILGMIFPGEIIWIQIAFVFEGLYMILSASTLIYQIQRVKRVVFENMLNSSSKSRVVSKMRTQQFYFMLTSSLGAIVNFLVAAKIIPLTWPLIMYWISIELSVSSLDVIEFFGTLVAAGSKRMTREETIQSNTQSNPSFFVPNDVKAISSVGHTDI